MRGRQHGDGLECAWAARAGRSRIRPYRTFTQDNLLSERTDAVLPRETLARQGMTLDQLGGILATQPVKAEVHHASDSSVDEFRKLASAYLGEPGHFVIVNYLRKAMGEQIGGHISPLAAYDGKADRFLILDVARYKYPPVWVKTADMFAAMNTPGRRQRRQDPRLRAGYGGECTVAPSARGADANTNVPNSDRLKAGSSILEATFTVS